MRKALFAAAGAAVLAALVAGCGSAAVDVSVSSGPTQSTSSEAVSSKVLVDVRTPQEFAEGHLDGAVNIPVESPDFAGQVLAVAGGGEVDLYCRSGNRSAQAASLLSGSGLTVVDLGGYDAAAAETGLPTVR